MLGALLLDRPRLGWPLLSPISARRRWATFHNRNERIIPGPEGRGFRCDWHWTSDLGLSRNFPFVAGRRLLRAALSEWPIVLREFAPSECVSNPDVSFIIGHRGAARFPLLEATLKSLFGQRGCTIEIIVVEQDARPLLREKLPAGVRWIPQSPSSPTAAYSRAWAFNEGARAARGRVLILHDNDILAPAAYASEVLRLAALGYEAASMMRFLFYLGESDKEVLLRSGDRLPEELARIAPERIQQNSQGGTIAVTREAYFRIGGHDESFVGWGGEDNEFYDRCASLKFYPWGYLPFVHLWHAPQPGRVRPAGHSGRLGETLETPREERIRRLVRRQFGDMNGPPRDAVAVDGVEG